jgi:glycerophosphoryl diester phosphodiesterase
MANCMIRRHPALFAAGIAAGVGAAVVYGMAPRTGNKTVDERWNEFVRYRYAHRGLHDDSLGAPENSLAAFRRAREYDFGVELDVHLTADDRLVVIHDSDLKRMTGKEGIVEELTRPQLEEYRLNGTNQGIPTLAEVLRIFEWDGRGTMPAPLIIEIKTYCENADLLTSRVMECLDTFDVRYCIESFDPAVLVWLRRNRPEVIRGQLSMDFLASDAGASAKALPPPLRVGATALLGNVAAKPDFIAYKFDDRKQPVVRLVCGLLGGKLITWTIRSERDMLASEAEGAPVIFEGFLPAPQSCVNAQWAGAKA